MRLSKIKNQATSFLDKYKTQSPAMYAAALEAIGGLLIFDGFFGLPHPLGGQKRPGIFGSLFGVVFGIIFMMVPTFFNSLSGMNNLKATTTATVVSNHQLQSQSTTSSGGTTTSTTCQPVVKYVVDGRQYSQASVDSSSLMCSYAPGQVVTIYYNAANPTQWSGDVKTVGSIMKIFFYAGLFVVISSAFLFIFRLLSIIFGWKILKSGRNLAKTLPEGTNLTGTIKQIESEFKSFLFGVSPGQTPAMPGFNNQQTFTNQPNNYPQPVNNPTPTYMPTNYQETIQPTQVNQEPAPQSEPNPPVDQNSNPEQQ